MSNDLDLNKLAAEFVQTNLEKIGEFAASKVKGARDAIRARLDKTYRQYLDRLLTRYSRAKSFFIRTEPIPLYHFFVPLDLATQVRTIRKPGAKDVADISQHAIIVGSGGSGKSMLMRHLLISTVANREKTPVFLELRQLNQQEEKLIDALLSSLQANGLDVDQSYFEIALKAGHFNLMLDGFDELERSRRKKVVQEIRTLAERYPGNWIMLSSRPDSELEGWEGFTIFNVKPLDLESAVELVHKLPFDDPIKDRFVRDLRTTLFHQHESFLSNPLLLSIMLLTYSDIAHIPNKLSIFYNQAYESLFQKHDALKGGFQRDRRSGLDIQDFSRAFAAFCVQSYDKREFSFSRTRALELLDHGKSISQLPYEPELLLEDAVQAVCLLLEEGMDLTFAHRSFQEYFVARFVHTCPPETKRLLIERFGKNAPSDAVISLLHEMDPYSVERYYLLPALSVLRKRIKCGAKLELGAYLRYMQAVYDSLEIRVNENDQLVSYIANMPLFWAIHFVHQRYVKRASASAQQTSFDEVKNALRNDFGGSLSVQTKNLNVKMSFVRLISSTMGSWGMEYLQEVLDAERTIKLRHRETQQSLEKILR